MALRVPPFTKGNAHARFIPWTTPPILGGWGTEWVRAFHHGGIDPISSMLRGVGANPWIPEKGDTNPRA